MQALTIAHHVVEHLCGERDGLVETVGMGLMYELAEEVLPELLERYDPATVKQVAVVIEDLGYEEYLGYSTGELVVLACDIQEHKVATLFLRNKGQGCPVSAQVYINLDGSPAR